MILCLKARLITAIRIILPCLNFSLRYDVRDYYGNIVDSGIFIDSTVFYGISANRNIKITGRYGMYYLNLYAVSARSTYMECYPFALLENYTYRYNGTSQFGLDAPHYNTSGQAATSASLCEKIEAATVRIGDNQTEIADILTRKGIKMYATVGTSMNVSATAYKSKVIKSMETLKDYNIDYYVISNEPDGGKDEDDLDDDGDTSERIQLYPNLCEILMKKKWLPTVYNPLKNIIG